MNFELRSNHLFDPSGWSKKVLLIWGFYSLIGFILFFFLLLPNLSSYRRSRRHLTLLRAELSRYKKKANQLSTIDDQQLELKVNKSMTILPLYHSAPLIISILSELGSESNLKLGNINFSPGHIASSSLSLSSRPVKKMGKKKKVTKLPRRLGVKELKLDVKVRGELKDVVHFLSTLEKIKPLVIIDKLSFSFASFPDFSSAEVEGNITLSFYAANLPSFLPSIDDPLFTPSVKEEERFQHLIQEYRGFSYAVANSPSSTGEKSGRDNPFVF